jgi:hypothetical protein
VGTKTTFAVHELPVERLPEQFVDTVNGPVFAIDVMPMTVLPVLASVMPCAEELEPSITPPNASVSELVESAVTGAAFIPNSGMRNNKVLEANTERLALPRTEAASSDKRGRR